MLKIRCSQIGKIMPGVRKDWLKGTEDYLFELFVSEKYRREKDIKSKYMEKGTIVEEDAISLLSDVTGKLYFKYSLDRLENEWITGTPDIWDKRNGVIRDIKSSWDVFTFEGAKRDKLNIDYYWQLQGYMDLTGAEVAYLDYCLVNTPSHIIEREQKYLEYDVRFSTVEQSDEARKELWENMTFTDIPKEERVHTKTIERNDDDIQLIHDRVELCREWYAENLSKNLKVLV